MPATFGAARRPGDEPAQESGHGWGRHEPVYDHGDAPGGRHPLPGSGNAQGLLDDTSGDRVDQHPRGGAHRGTSRMLLFGRRLLARLVGAQASSPAGEDQ
jgi:hypothetical protein